MSARTKAFATAALASACAFANAAPTISWSDDTKPYTDVGSGFGSRLFSSSTSTLILEEGTFKNDGFRWGTPRPDGNGARIAATDVGTGGHDNQSVSISLEAAPKPSRWMMMISGIGMLGAIVVRRTLMD
jgi:hypothetical protein